MSAFLLRPSAAGMWMRCAGYATMHARYPERPGDNEVREEGTAGHWAAFEIGNGRAVPVGTIAPNGVELTDDILDGVHEYLDVLRSWGVPVYLEHSVVIPSIHATECGGQVDAWAWDAAKRILYVGDLKLGYKQVEAFDNYQLLCYVRGVIDYLQSIDGKFTEHFEVVMVIVQPRGYGYPTLKTWRTTTDKLIDRLRRLKDAADRAVFFSTAGVEGWNNQATYMVGNWGDPLTAGPHCDNCNAAGNCPALAQASMAVVDTSGKATPHDATPQQVGYRLRRLMRARDTIDAEIDALKARLEHEIRQNGTAIPYFGLDVGKGKDVWIEGKEKDAITTAKLCGADIQKPAKPLTVIQARAALRFIAPGLIDQYTEHRPGAQKLRLLPENHAEKLFQG